MSDDDHDIDMVDTAEKRAHHNALERKRRDHLKESFASLKDSVPSLLGEKSVSRAMILKRTADYIQLMRNKNVCHQKDIDDLRRQNSLLEIQIRTLEKAKAAGNYATESSESALNGSGSDNSDVSNGEVQKSIMGQESKNLVIRF